VITSIPQGNQCSQTYEKLPKAWGTGKSHDVEAVT
jgi:hypothetical protein